MAAELAPTFRNSMVGSGRDRHHGRCWASRFRANPPPGRRPAGGLCWWETGRMPAWQYAQLTIRLEGRGGESSRTIIWHGPGQGPGRELLRQRPDGAGADEQGRCRRLGAGRPGRAPRRRRWPHLLGCRLVPDHLHIQAPGAPVGWHGVQSWSPSRQPLVRSLSVAGRRSYSW